MSARFKYSKMLQIESQIQHLAGGSAEVGSLFVLFSFKQTQLFARNSKTDAKYAESFLTKFEVF